MYVQMCNIVPIENVIPNWKSLNDSYVGKGKAITFVAISTLIRYCDNCGAKMYWPVLGVDFNEKLLWNDTYDKQKWLSGILDKFRNQKAEVEKMCRETTLCPICGEPLSNEKGYYDHQFHTLSGEKIDNLEQLAFDESGWRERLDFYFGSYRHSLQGIRNSNEKFINRKKFEKCIEEIKGEVSNMNLIPAENLDSKKIKESVDDLCKYLSNLIKLEQNIDLLEKRLNTLIDRISKIQREVRHNKYDIQWNKSKELDLEKQQVNESIEKFGTYSYKDFGLITLAMPEVPIEPVRPVEPVYEKPGLFNRKKILAQNAALEQKYNDDLTKYESAITDYQLLKKQYEKECLVVSKKNKEQAEILKAKKDGLIQQAKESSRLTVSKINEKYQGMDSMLHTIEQSLVDEFQLGKDNYKQLLIAREKYYLTNIVYAKYRNIAAITTMYEYLKSGRCTTLEGTNGAYSLYESELRADIIIEKLDTVITQLEKIKKSQYMLYEIMNSTNNKLSKMGEKMDSVCNILNDISASTDTIRDNSEIIKGYTAITAYNTAKTAFYSEMTAAISTAMMFRG